MWLQEVNWKVQPGKENKLTSSRMLTCQRLSETETDESNMIQLFVSGSWHTTSVKSWLSREETDVKSDSSHLHCASFLHIIYGVIQQALVHAHI